ncbi:MAG: pyrimidine/purine nucleoside phosphorylase [Bacteroidota bacterium]|nr:pyrimidine/purine nucleoside phosphorylase [Bacteroidota bacterium]
MIQVNEYFDGAVKSLAYQTEAGKSSVGVIGPGTYTFGTAQPEIMTIIEGKLEVLLQGSTNWQSYTAGQAFDVPGNSSFQVKTEELTSYLCQYR